MNETGTICAMCFTPADEVVYTCHTPGCTCANAPQPLADTVTDSEGYACCTECKNQLTQQLCPRCGYPLPRKEETSRIPLLLMGAAGCGKSTYLAVMLHRIRQELCKSYNCALYPQGGDRTMQYYERVYSYPLFSQGRCPHSTEPEDVEPQAYSLNFVSDPPAGKPCTVCFYDSSGRSLDSERTAAQHNRGLPWAGGILFLIDPSQFPEPQQHLLAAGKPVLRADAAEQLSRLVHIIRAAQNLGNVQRKIDIPIAVCLTKMDTVMKTLDPSSFIGHPSRHLRSAALDRIDLDCCDMEVRSLIESWGGRELVALVRAQFSEHRFFSVSALGAPPRESHVQRIAPHRVLDPLLWLLSCHGIVDIR